MDGPREYRLELGTKPSTESDSPATYTALPEADMEEEAITRPKSIVKSKPATPEADGADEKMLTKEDVVQVKVSTNEKQNGDAKLDIGELKTAFVGLTKEELMKYANDPFWVRIRWFLFISFWILWGMMLLGAIMIILAAPKCNPPPPRTWWEKGPLAELDQAQSDLDQITKLKELGVTGVVVSWPEDSYVDFDDTHDFIKSLKTYKDEEINIIVELEPGFSNIWFNKSQFKDPEFKDYYIWRPAKDQSNGEAPQVPNNWLTVENKTAWIYSDKRNEYYYAPIGKPHLNFRNPNVTQRFSEVVKKFVGLGVGGVRLKGAPNLVVDAKFTDEGHVASPGDCVLTDYCFYTHTQTENLNDLAPLLQEWRTVLKNNTDNGPFMVAEDISPNIEAYKINSSYIVDLPVQSHLFYRPDVNVSNIVHVLNTTFSANNITWPLWKANSTSEWDTVTYLLPGTPLVTPNSLPNEDIQKVRSSPSIMRGTFNLYSLNNGTVLAFIRVTAGNPGILVAHNPTDNRVSVDFPANIEAVSKEVTVLLYSNGYNETGVNINVKHDANSVPISPKSTIVLSYVPPSK